MKYSVPVNAPEEVEQLVAAGADELYCGFQDAWWIERYGDHDSASRRQGRANLCSADELFGTVERARACGVPLYLALNSRYTEPQLDHLEELCGTFSDAGGTGVIASDLGLIWRLRNHSGLAVVLSLLAVAQNAPTMAVFAQLGVDRVVFPRFIGPEEASRLLAAVPGMQGEVMAFFDKCPMVDGYCRHRHGVSYPDRDAADGDDGAQPIYTFDTVYRTHACLRGSSEYLEPNPCAACFLQAFERAGVGFAKLGGRGRPLEERVRALTFLHEAEGLASDAERAELYRRTFNAECACYYGPFTQNRYAIEPVEACLGLEGRMVVGSQTDYGQFDLALDALCERSKAISGTFAKDAPGAMGFALLVPPLSDEGLARLLGALPDLAAQHSGVLCLYANDLGTYVSLKRAIDAAGYGYDLEVACGTLLSRWDDPREIAHFLAPAENPPRPVWGPEGEPRVLVYREPPAPLRKHWQRPSLDEPSAREALKWVAQPGSMPSS